MLGLIFKSIDTISPNEFDYVSSKKNVSKSMNARGWVSPNRSSYLYRITQGKIPHRAHDQTSDIHELEVLTRAVE